MFVLNVTMDFTYLEELAMHVKTWDVQLAVLQMYVNNAIADTI